MQKITNLKEYVNRIKIDIVKHARIQKTRTAYQVAFYINKKIDIKRFDKDLNLRGLGVHPHTPNT